VLLVTDCGVWKVVIFGISDPSDYYSITVTRIGDATARQILVDSNLSPWFCKGCRRVKNLSLKRRSEARNIKINPDRHLSMGASRQCKKKISF
jgi:hypothetical protein